MQLHCAACRYELSGTDVVRCPECGLEARPVPEFRRGREIGLFLAGACLPAFGVCVACAGLLAAASALARADRDLGAMVAFALVQPLACVLVLLIPVLPIAAAASRGRREDGWARRGMLRVGLLALGMFLNVGFVAGTIVLVRVT